MTSETSGSNRSSSNPTVTCVITSSGDDSGRRATIENRALKMAEMDSTVLSTLRHLGDEFATNELQLSALPGDPEVAARASYCSGVTRASGTSVGASVRGRSEEDATVGIRRIIASRGVIL